MLSTSRIAFKSTQLRAASTVLRRTKVTLPELEWDFGALGQQIEKQYGSLDKLIEVTNAKLAGVQGSGWAFIVKNLENGGQLDVVQTYNQDTVGNQFVPLVAIDAWEHAYYLQYQNKKVDYFKAIWNVINWKEAAKRYETSKVTK